MEVVELSPTGTVWTWTSQEFLPKAPPYAGEETAETFQPYYVGYVELEGELRVESRLVGFADGPPHIGQQVETVVQRFRTDEDSHFDRRLPGETAEGMESDSDDGDVSHLVTPSSDGAKAYVMPSRPRW